MPEWLSVSQNIQDLFCLSVESSLKVGEGYQFDCMRYLVCVSETSLQIAL